MTNNFPNIGYITNGKDYNFYKNLSITAATFGGASTSGAQPDIIITFTTYGSIFTNLTSASGHIVEYSFNGQTVHGILDGSNQYLASLNFSNRVISLVWFRIQAGSSGPANVIVQAWGGR